MRILFLSTQRICWIFWFFSLVKTSTSDDQDTCTSATEGGTCQPLSAHDAPAQYCTTRASLYENGGSAQAYRSGAPVSNEVCRLEFADEYRYKTASWPFLRRSMRKGSAPKLDVTLHIFSCQSSNGSDCICQPIDPSVAKSARSKVEVWQTRPDGLYSSLRPAMPDSNDCRAQVPMEESGVARFTTVAPGSTGVMGGLGPGGWEWSPYGPPVIHMLVQATGHAPLLVDLPILVQTKTLEPRKFSVGDFRGSAWARKKSGRVPLEIKSWKPNVAENRIVIEVNIFLRQSPRDEPELCPSYLYGLPSSFFLEPMSICAPSMLDFFSV